MKKVTRSQQILLNARALMLEKGYHSTRLDDICEATLTPKGPLSKGGLFHHFKSKEDIGRRTLKAYIIESLEPFEILSNASPTPNQFIQILDGILNKTDQEILEGSLLGIMVQELSRSDNRLKIDIQDHLNDWHQLIENYFTSIQSESSHDYSSSELASFFLTVYEGSFLIGRGLQDASHFLASIRQFRNFYGSLFDLT